MVPDGLEVEIKLAMGSAEEARALLAGLGAELRTARTFEDNVLYDRPRGELAREGRILRLRRFGERVVLTYKEPPASRDPGVAAMKVMTERECQVSSFEEMRAILEGLGFVKVYRYQKYREELALPELAVTVDETPIGTFVELEGRPERIRAVAAALGKGPDGYLAESYRELHRRRCSDAGEPAGDMVFPGRG